MRAGACGVTGKETVLARAGACGVTGKETVLARAGACGVVGEDVLVARAALHMWEEPCISGEYGSGAVFFSGCPLHCVYCQNEAISHARAGKRISVGRLAEIFLELQGKKAANINLVTPTHYTPQIIHAVELARRQGLGLPIVYNCSGYEKVDTLKLLEGIVDVYLVDFKYMEEELAANYSKALDYPRVAKAALAEMVRQVGAPKLEYDGGDEVRQERVEFDEEGMMKWGVIVRHLLLPGHLQNAKKVVCYVYQTYGNQVYLSLMNQYTPMPEMKDKFEQNGWPKLNRRVTRREYERLVEYAISLGVENGFVQEGETAGESFIPAFDNEGVLPSVHRR
jgi:putative pyruvate formate lyase activating enzyme